MPAILFSVLSAGFSLGSNIGRIHGPARAFRATAAVLPDGPRFTPERGFYDHPFDLTVSSESSGAIIRYTLDGSDPRVNPAAFEAQAPVVIRVDPANPLGRGLTPAVAVRAVALAGGAPVTGCGANTYIFLPSVPAQKDPGGAWPRGKVKRETLDYDMDPAVVTDPRYKSLLADALLDIPSFCINTDPGSLFDPDSGIYVNPTERGREWERAASIELIDPRGREPGFQINAGIRIRGGYSRIGAQPKHAFRFYFRGEYGKGKLDYPLFQDEGVSSFDGVDLRTAQNYSWSYMGYSGAAGIFIRDVFSRDCQRDMGQAYTRSRACHLYLNGMYWGLYQTQERSEASYAESYFGGDADQYDVVKVDPVNGMVIEATDGTLAAWSSLWFQSMDGFQTNEAFFRVQGRNPDGTENRQLPALANLENLIDYLLIVYYTGNFDAPVTAFGSNRRPNNFYGIYDRLGRTGFLFFAHDAEHTLMDPQFSENPDYGFDRTGPYPCGDQQQYFNPQWLHQQLAENPEYRVLFSDRVARHLLNRGALTADASRARMAPRRDEIAMAVIAESARWGDSKVHPPRTKDDDWIPAVEWVMNVFFEDRSEIVVDQLREDGLVPSLDAPVFRAGSEDLPGGFWDTEPGAAVRLVNPNTGGNGSVFYTLDGTDPRRIGGAAVGSALDAGDDTEITVPSSAVLKARVRDGSEWSALQEVLIRTGRGYSGLSVTEIMYNPLGDDGSPDTEYEFLELKNRGTEPVLLSGARFVQGLGYDFPDGAILDPGGFWILASNAGMFASRYGFRPAGEYAGQLDNGGERVTLVDAAGDTLVTVRYKDEAPWPVEPDSTGRSLVPSNLQVYGNPNEPEYWTVSSNRYGSPAADDAATGVEFHAHVSPDGFVLEQNFPNPFNPATNVRFSLPRRSFLKLSIMDAMGKEVARIAHGYFQEGMHSIKWDASELASGLYFCRLDAGNLSQVRKMVLIK